MDKMFTYTGAQQQQAVAAPTINLKSKAAEAFDSLSSIVTAGAKISQEVKKQSLEEDKHIASTYTMGMDMKIKEYTELMNSGVPEDIEKATKIYETYSKDYAGVMNTMISDEYLKSELTSSVFNKLTSWSNTHNAYEVAQAKAAKKQLDDNDTIALNTLTSNLSVLGAEADNYVENNQPAKALEVIEKADKLYKGMTFNSQLAASEGLKLVTGLSGKFTTIQHKAIVNKKKKGLDEFIFNAASTGALGDYTNFQAYSAQASEIEPDSNKIKGNYVTAYLNTNMTHIKNNFNVDTLESSLADVRVLEGNFKTLASNIELSEASTEYNTNLNTIQGLREKIEDNVRTSYEDRLRNAITIKDIKSYGDTLVKLKLMNTGEAKELVSTQSNALIEKQEKKAKQQRYLDNWETTDVTAPDVDGDTRYKIEQNFAAAVRSGNLKLISKLATTNPTLLQKVIGLEVSRSTNSIMHDPKNAGTYIGNLSKLKALNVYAPGVVPSDKVTDIAIMESYYNNNPENFVTNMSKYYSNKGINISLSEKEQQEIRESLPTGTPYEDAQKVIIAADASKKAGTYTEDVKENLINSFKPYTTKKGAIISTSTTKELGINGESAEVLEVVLKSQGKKLDNTGAYWKGVEDTGATVYIQGNMLHIDYPDGKVDTFDKKMFLNGVDITAAKKEVASKSIGSTKAEFTNKVDALSGYIADNKDKIETGVKVLTPAATKVGIKAVEAVSSEIDKARKSYKILNKNK